MNNNISNIHLDILDAERKNILKKIIPLTTDFLLGGGTALALQITHRKSFDFDFFSETSIPKNLLELLSQKINIQNISIDSQDELTFFTENDIKLTFLHYPFRHTYTPLVLENNLHIFDIKDIAIQKAYTIGRRGEYRDYFDLYTIIKNNYITLDKLILLVKQVYGGAFDKKLFLEQLVYFGDISNFNIIPANGEVVPTPEDIKIFFEKLVKNIILT